jgi:2,4-dienoyl-CoA reductase-like NADH-dependent reductase (Old Yellow Enzyme family)
VAPTAIPFAPGWPVPQALDESGIQRLISAWVNAAERAVRAGFDFIEVHGAHGYLLHEFLSPLSNQRTDHWGGSLENRMRFVVAVTKAIRATVPTSLTIGVRLSASDWTEGGFTIEEAVAVSRALKEAGAAYIGASSGGGVHDAKVPLAPGYQVPFATRIRKEAGIITRAVGLIDDPHQAEAIVAEGKADLVALARAMLADPRWPWRAAAALGEPLNVVPQYARSAPFVERWVKAGT